MESLKKLSADILNKGVPDRVIVDLLECAPKTVYIEVTDDRNRYRITYINALAKYLLRHSPYAETGVDAERHPRYSNGS